MPKITEVEGRWRAFVVMGVAVRRQMADPSQNKRAIYSDAFLQSDRGRWSHDPIRHADGLQIMGITEADVRDFYTPSDWDRVCDMIDAQARIEIAILEADRNRVRVDQDPTVLAARAALRKAQKLVAAAERAVWEGGVRA